MLWNRDLARLNLDENCIYLYVTRLLLLDDEEPIRLTLCATLRTKGFDVTTAGTVREALELINTKAFDALLADLNLGEAGDGFTVVSAMRRVQPEACTFILTGYPDFESALRAIRNQVDDFFTKPTDPETLAKAVQERVATRTPAKPAMRLKRVADILREQLPSIVEQWLGAVEAHPHLSAIPLAKAERTDHVPAFIAEIVSRLERRGEDTSPSGVDAAQKHGRQRYQQGYTLAQVVSESRILQHTLTSIVEGHLIGVELSNLIHDMFQAGESLNSLLEISVHAYQSVIPRSLQNSLSVLYHSAHLGVAIANEERIVDANDALLRMLGFSREDLVAGKIDWHAMTPPEYHEQDTNGVAQLREFGVCVPFEKEFILPDGTRWPFMIGAVRLGTEPFEWAAYIVDLREQRRVLAAESRATELQSKYALINQLAHEINNPLAALTFSLHLLKTYPGLPEDVGRFIQEASEMVDRISGSVQAVLAAARSSDEQAELVPE
jgi:PAS domain S-box-containing protein